LKSLAIVRDGVNKVVAHYTGGGTADEATALKIPNSNYKAFAYHHEPCRLATVDAAYVLWRLLDDCIYSNSPVGTLSNALCIYLAKRGYRNVSGVLASIYSDYENTHNSIDYSAADFFSP